MKNKINFCSDEALQKFLNYCGYWKELHNKPFTKEMLEVATKEYQKFYGLIETGLIDNEMIEQISMPRCGVADFTRGFINTFAKPLVSS